MDKYPFLNLIKARLKEKGEKIGWLAGEVGRSIRWVELLDDIEDVNLGHLLKISKVLEFDFTADYYKWIGANASVLKLAEPTTEYKRTKPDAVTITITVRGDVKNASKVLENIKSVSAKNGYEVD